MNRNPQIDLAERYVNETGISLFLTGKAGTGKTTFLRHIDAHCHKRHVVVAPTGVAAVNAGGTCWLIAVLLCAMAAYVLSRKRTKLNNFIYYFFICGLFFPVNYVTLVRVFNWLSLTNTRLGIILDRSHNATVRRLGLQRSGLPYQKGQQNEGEYVLEELHYSKLFLSKFL